MKDESWGICLHPSSFILHPSSFRLPPSSFILWRRRLPVVPRLGDVEEELVVLARRRDHLDDVVAPAVELARAAADSAEAPHAVIDPLVLELEPVIGCVAGNGDRGI